MNRRLPALLIAATVAGLVLGDCGIPDNTGVVPLRPGPSTGVSAGGDLAPSRTVRADATDRAQFVENYLEAAAGDITGAVERAKQFMTPDAAAKFRAGSDITVVRQVEEPLVEPGRADVEVRVRVVGTLHQEGFLEPETADKERTLKFSVGVVEGQQGLFLTSAPDALLLSDQALIQFYAPRLIYFWNQAHTGLVPDLRYMPLSVPLEQQPTVILDWLTAGPAPWLNGVVDALPEGTKPIGNVPAVADETLRINLSDQAVPANDSGALDRLQKQLRWSLRSNLPGALELAVEHQAEQRYTGTDYYLSNPAYRLAPAPERFVIFNGRIHRVAKSYRVEQPVPVVGPEDNHNVQTAAVAAAGDRYYAALAVTEGQGQALRIGAAGPGEQTPLRAIAVGGTLGRPVWAKSPTGEDAATFGLVTLDGQLWSFNAAGTSFRQVQWPDAPEQITAIAVAPDARRVAVVAGGRLYLATLARTADGVELTTGYRMRTVLRNLTAVDWASEGFLVVAGYQPDSPRVAMMDVSVDGARQSPRLRDLGTKPVTQVATLAANPGQEGTTGAVAYVQDVNAYDEVKTGPLQVSDLADPPANPPAGKRPTAPFFVN